jgi:hypothetical protein
MVFEETHLCLTSGSFGAKWEYLRLHRLVWWSELYLAASIDHQHRLYHGRRRSFPDAVRGLVKGQASMHHDSTTTSPVQGPATLLLMNVIPSISWRAVLSTLSQKHFRTYLNSPVAVFEGCHASVTHKPGIVLSCNHRLPNHSYSLLSDVVSIVPSECKVFSQLTACPLRALEHKVIRRAFSGCVSC